MFTMLEILAPFCIGAPMMMLLAGNGKYTSNETLSVIPMFLIAFIQIIVLCCELNLITYPFTKPTFFLYDDHFSHQETDVRYDAVTQIELDGGVAKRHGGSKPCHLDCYSGDELLISLKDPSLWLIVLVIHRCKNAKSKYKRVKQVLLIWAFSLLLCLAYGLYGSIVG
jgi:hypothetical protein